MELYTDIHQLKKFKTLSWGYQLTRHAFKSIYIFARCVEVPSWNGQQNILFEGLNHFNGANLTLNSDVDQNT